MQLYMVRHGESTANVKRLHAGWAQIPLTAKGRNDAKNTRILIKGISFDRVYSSDLLRARQTAEIALPGIKPILTDLIREINVGELCGKGINECINLYGQRYLEDKAMHDFRFYGGESQDMHQMRVKNFLDLLSTQNAENIAAFCHEGTIRCAMKIVNYKYANNTIIHNGGVFVFGFSGDTWEYISELNI